MQPSSGACLPNEEATLADLSTNATRKQAILSGNVSFLFQRHCPLLLTNHVAVNFIFASEGVVTQSSCITQLLPPINPFQKGVK